MLFFIKKLCIRYVKGIAWRFRHYVSDPTLYHIREYIQKIKNFIYPSVSIFDGLEKNSKSPLAFAHVGCFLPLEQYWTHISFGENFQKRDMGRHFVWNILSFLKSVPFKCDFLILDNHILTLLVFRRAPGFKIPQWVSMGLDISMPIEKLLGIERHNIERRIRKNKLSYMEVKDKESFDDFYYNMFVPYISKKHSLTAYITPYKKLWEIFSKGGLIFIKKEANIIAGQLYENIDQTIKLHSLGIRDGKWEYVQDGALSAAYYFMIIEIKKYGHSKLNIGLSRPVLNDGVTKHKTSLGAYFIKDKEYPCLWLGLLRNSIGLKHFLTNNPFIFLNKKSNFYGAIFGEIEGEELPQECENIVKSSCGNLKRTYFFTFDKSNIDQHKNASQKYSFIVKSIEDMIIK